MPIWIENAIKLLRRAGHGYYALGLVVFRACAKYSLVPRMNDANERGRYMSKEPVFMLQINRDLVTSGAYFLEIGSWLSTLVLEGCRGFVMPYCYQF